MEAMIRSAERTKRLRIEPAGQGLARFKATLEDRADDAAQQELIHSLVLEGTLALQDLTIATLKASALHQPYPECQASLAPMQGLVGMRIGPGYRARVQQLIGSTRGCTHFLSLALDLAASHTLTTFLRMREQASLADRDSAEGRWMKVGLQIEPRLENACIALTSDSRVIRNARGPD